jgi:hypothetical protein
MKFVVVVLPLGQVYGEWDHYSDAEDYAHGAHPGMLWHVTKMNQVHAKRDITMDILFVAPGAGYSTASIGANLINDVRTL